MDPSFLPDNRGSIFYLYFPNVMKIGFSELPTNFSVICPYFDKCSKVK